MTAICRLCVLVPLACLADGTAGDEEASKYYMERCRWIMEQDESTDFNAAEQRLWQEWGATDHALVGLLERTDSDHTRLHAIRRLADMRSTQAVWPLARQITLEGLGILDLQEPLWRYPAALALAKIGLPAVRVILRDWLYWPRTDQELELCAAVVRRHYLLEPAVGRFHIQHMLEEANKRLEGEDQPHIISVTWRDNLGRVLELYDAIGRGELFPGFPRPKRAGAEKQISPAAPEALHPSSSGRVGSELEQ